MRYARQFRTIFPYACLLIVMCLCDIYFGAVKLSFVDILSHDEATLNILQLRSVSMLQALTVGAVLSLCGVVLQKILKNPLADPFILGISSGGSCMSVLFIILNISSFEYLNSVNRFFPVQSMGAVLGCLFALFCFNFLKKKIKSTHSEFSYLIIGIILNSFFSAFLMILLSLANEAQLSSFHTWIIGSLQPISAVQLGVLVCLSAVGIFSVLKFAPFLNYLLLDDDFSKSLGVCSDKMRNQLIFILCLLIALVVSVSGTIGFVGLIVPHYVRGLKVSSQRLELWMCLVCGGIVLVVADLMSKILMPPVQLPLGIFTALLGAPALAMILLKGSVQARTSHP